jgi:uncharacterized iron-regulated membrane protein
LRTLGALCPIRKTVGRKRVPRRRRSVRMVGQHSCWRRAHFWLGVVAGLYVVFISVTGSAIVFDHELYRFFSPDPPLSPEPRGRLDDGSLKAAVASHHPSSIVIGLWDRRLTAGMAAEAWLDGSSGIVRRLIHPATGEDLGDAQPLALRMLAFLRRAHVTALAGSSGKIINATGALSLIALSISGLAARRRASASSGCKRNTLTYHKIVGTLGGVFGILWGATGAYLALTTVFAGLLGAANEPLFDWAYQLHTGSAGGLTTRLLWISAALGLALAAATGLILWWRRLRFSPYPRSEEPRSPLRRALRLDYCFGPPSSSSADDNCLPPGISIIRPAATNGSDFAR